MAKFKLIRWNLISIYSCNSKNTTPQNLIKLAVAAAKKPSRKQWQSCGCNETAVCISLGISNISDLKMAVLASLFTLLSPTPRGAGLFQSAHVNVVTFGELSFIVIVAWRHTLTSLPRQHKSQPCLSNYFWFASLLWCQYVTDIEQRASEFYWKKVLPIMWIW